MNKILSRVSLSCAIVLGTFACYPPEPGTGSQQKSLDNFAAGGIATYNWCGSNDTSTIAPRDITIVTASQEARDAVLGTLSAVPDELLTAFRSVNGMIVARPDAESVCAQATKSNSEKDLRSGAKVPSCWFQKEVGESPQIVVSSDPRLIRHSMIRAFSYFFTEFFVARAKLPGAGQAFTEPGWREAFAKFESTQAVIAQAFLADVSTTSRDLATQFERAYTTDREHFSNYVLAEALDSCHCSDRTRAVFREKFPRTWGALNCRQAN